MKNHKWKLLIGAAVLVVLVFALFSKPLAKRTVSEHAVAIHRIHLNRILTDHINAVVLLTNRTEKAITVQFVAMEGGYPDWTNYTEPFNGNAVITLPAGGRGSVASQPILFSGIPPSRPWRFRLIVREELKGMERVTMAFQAEIKRMLWKLRGRQFPRNWVGSVQVYFGHRTEIIVSEELDYPHPENL